MPSIASSATDSAAATGRRISASGQTTCALDQDVAAAVDGGRPRAPEAVKAAGRESGRGRPDDDHGAGPSQATGGLVIYAKVSAMSSREAFSDGDPDLPRRLGMRRA